MAQAYIPAHGGPSVAVSHLGSEATGATEAPGPVGAGPDGSELQFPFIQVVAVKFESDHKKRMTDKDYFGPGGTPDGSEVSYESGGTPFAKDFAWKRDPSTLVTETHPVSHTGDQKVTLSVTVRLKGSNTVKGTLIGRATGAGVPEGMKFVAHSQIFHLGDMIIEVDSNKRLSKRIEKVQFNVDWQVVGPGLLSVPIISGGPWVLAKAVRSRNELFVTMGEPQYEDELEITYGRMAHAVEKAEAAVSADPHQIVGSIVDSLSNRYDGGFSGDTWLLARNPGSKADCITIAKYVDAILKLIGLPGTAEAVIVYVQPNVRPMGRIRWKWLKTGEKLQLLDDVGKGDFKIVERSSPADPEKAGLNSPVIVHPTEDWYLRLIDDEGDKNIYEGCVKFTDDKGHTKWYPAGLLPGGGGQKLEKVIPRAFKSLSWVSNDGWIREPPVEEYMY